MQLELELHWYTDQLGKLVSQEITEWVWLVEWAFNHTHFALCYVLSNVAAILVYLSFLLLICISFTTWYIL